MNKLELVRKYEPVLLFSKNDDGVDEKFFPCAVDHFIAESRLYHRGKKKPIELPGGLNLDTIADIPTSESIHYYLSYTADRLVKQSPSTWEWLQYDGLARFSVSSSDEEDDEFSDEELLEGGDDSFGLVDKVTQTQQLPPEVTDMAIAQYQPYTDFNKYPPVYYYRLMCNRGYLVLQYWFFYVYNDWGTTHGGMNDHEGDWELVTIFLDGQTPVHAAYAAHTEGLRPYKWDDIQKYRGSHPVVYVGAGSHASYTKKKAHRTAMVLKDYAYGNSDIKIGPGTDIAWGEPVNIARERWAHTFAGRWGSIFKRFGSETVAQGTRGPQSPPWQFDPWERPVYEADIED